MERILDVASKVLLGLLLAVVLLFCGDWGVLLLKISQHSNAFGTVTVHTVITSALKSGKYDIYAQQPEQQQCIHAIFPHQGYSPCWYLARHTEQVTAY